MNVHRVVGGSMVMLLLSSVAAFAANAKVEVKVESGVLRGVAQDGVLSFKGIPYAQPPVGNLRWQPPQPAAHWQGVLSAAQYGHDCMQLPFPSDAAPLGTQPAEDCLVMNIWRPAEKTSAKMPVMVWIYGGGYVNGGSSPAVYDGSQFAKHGIVFVSFNYRVGRFGFFAHPALTAEAGSGLTGNYTFMDQIAALKWVRDNIEAFGGDAGKVTLFGESAGGGSVLTMMTSPLSRGLFQQAIIESGGGRSRAGGMRLLSEALPDGKTSAESIGVAFAKANGIEGTGPEALKALRALPAEAVVNSLNMASMRQAASTYSGPMIDGKLVVESPESAFEAGRQMKIPLIIGDNSMDAGFATGNSVDAVLEGFGADKTKAAAAYDPDGSSNARMVAARVGADRMMDEPARFIVRTVAASGQPAYEYRFSYVASSMRERWPGAPHATEIPYVFDTVKAKYGADLTPSDAAIAKAMNDYWSAYVKTGSPNATGLPAWPEYKAESDILMDFTPQGPKAVPDPWKERLDLTEKLQTAQP